MSSFKNYKLSDKEDAVIAIAAAILAFIVLSTLSWAITCGIIKLITLCFSLTFSFKIATGIWLVMFLLGGIFKK